MVLIIKMTLVPIVHFSHVDHQSLFCERLNHARNKQLEDNCECFFWQRVLNQILESAAE